VLPSVDAHKNPPVDGTRRALSRLEPRWAMPRVSAYAAAVRDPGPSRETLSRQLPPRRNRQLVVFAWLAVLAGVACIVGAALTVHSSWFWASIALVVLSSVGAVGSARAAGAPHYRGWAQLTIAESSGSGSWGGRGQGAEAVGFAFLILLSCAALVALAAAVFR